MKQSVTYSRNGNIGLITIANPPVNALNTGVRMGLLESLNMGLTDEDSQALVIVGAGRVFSAGADIQEFNREPLPPSLPEVVSALEDSSKLMVAAVRGVALGGGMEITLGCDYRIAASDARMGLPEVNLGLIPGAGGTQRLPRLVGLRAALEIIINGHILQAPDLTQIGAVDRISQGDLNADAIAYARELVASEAPKRPLCKFPPATFDSEAFEKYRGLVERKKRGYEAPVAALAAIRAAAQLGFAEGMARERELFLQQRESSQASAQRHVFVAERVASKVATNVSPDTSLHQIRRAAVVGAGTMGTGITISLLDAGLPVVLIERDSEALQRSIAKIDHHYQAQISKQRISESAREKRRNNLTWSTEFNAAANVDLVIEAVFENLEVKLAVFKELDKHCHGQAILATNTSTLDVGKIAAAVRRPEKMVGLHFFSPAYIMRLVEIVRTQATSAATLKTASRLVKRMGKIGVVVGVCYGFVGNRILHKRQAQAVALVAEGARPEQIDRVLRDFGMPMGPFAMWDMAGLDISYSAREAVRLHDPGHAPARSWIDEVVEAGRLGQKTGGGVFDYVGQKPVHSFETAEIIESFRRRKKIASRTVKDLEIRERCLYVMVNEACRVLEENIATRPSDVDVIMVNGFGFPRYLGGLMYWADQVGLPLILGRIRDFYAKTGNQDWFPAPLLVELVRQNRNFADSN